MIKKITINPKNVFKRFIFFNIRAIIAYHITLFLLGYSSFKPLVIRGFNVLTNPETFPSYVAESDTLFLICAPKESLLGTVSNILGGTTTSSGFTLAQMAVCGLTMASVMFGLHLAQEYVVPPIMRGLGWTSWKTARELAAENAVSIDALTKAANGLKTEVTEVKGVVERGTQSVAQAFQTNSTMFPEQLEGAITRLKKSFRFEVDHIVKANVKLNRKLDNLGVNVSELVTFSTTMANLTERINTLASDTTATIKNDLTTIFSTFNQEHAEVERALKETLTDLREQASSFDSFNPEGILGCSTDRINEAIALLENAIQKHASAGSQLQEKVAPQLIHLGEVQDKASGLTKCVVQRPKASAQPSASSKQVLEGLHGQRMKLDAKEALQESARLEYAKSIAATRQTHQLATTTRSVPDYTMAEGVNFNITQEGGEIVIRLRVPEGTKLQSLSDISTMAVTPKKPSGLGSLISPDITTDLSNRMTNFVWDQATTKGFQLALGVGAAALSGGVPGVANYMGGGKLTASLLNAVTTVPAKTVQTTMFENFVGTVEKGLTVYKAINNK